MAHPRASTRVTNAATAFIAIGIIATAVISSTSIGIAIVIATKAEPKSVPGEALGHLKFKLIDSKSVPEAFRTAWGRPKVFRERLGSVSGRPRHVSGGPGDSPKTPRSAKKSSRERPGAR